MRRLVFYQNLTDPTPSRLGILKQLDEATRDRFANKPMGSPIDRRWTCWCAAHRLRWRIGLRSLLIAIAVIGPLLALVGREVNQHRVRQQQAHLGARFNRRDHYNKPGRPLSFAPGSAFGNEDIGLLEQRDDLIALSLERTQVTSAGLENLPRLTRLEWLRLDSMAVFEDDFEFVAHMPSLKGLFISNTDVTKIATDALSEDGVRSVV